jgi:hypothetical protein
MFIHKIIPGRVDQQAGKSNFSRFGQNTCFSSPIATNRNYCSLLIVSMLIIAGKINILTRPVNYQGKI